MDAEVPLTRNDQQPQPDERVQRGPSTARRRFPLGWAHRLGIQLRYGRKTVYRQFVKKTPLGQLQVLAVALLLACGTALAILLVLPQLDRALVLSGRTEVLAMRLNHPAFGALQFDDAIIRPDPDTPAQRGRLKLDIAPGTTVRFVRSGRGNLRLAFEADAAATAGEGCTPGLRQIGNSALDEAAQPLCEAAVVVVPLAAGAEPLVLSLSGDLVVGEEVSQGAGPRPILLEATASLLVKHNNALFRWACRVETIENLVVGQFDFHDGFRSYSPPSVNEDNRSLASAILLTICMVSTLTLTTRIRSSITASLYSANR